MSEILVRPIDSTTFFFDGRESLDLDGRIVQYEWRLGDGTFATTPTIFHEFQESGSYRVFLTVTDDQGNAATHSMILQVS